MNENPDFGIFSISKFKESLFQQMLVWEQIRGQTLGFNTNLNFIIVKMALSKPIKNAKCLYIGFQYVL